MASTGVKSEQLSQPPYHYTKKVVLRVGVDSLTVEAWISDLVVPVLGGVRHPSLHGGLVLLLGVPAPVGVLTHRGSVQFLPYRVVTKGALVSPPLSHGLQLRAPDLTQGKGLDVLVLLWSALTSFFMLVAPG